MESLSGHSAEVAEGYVAIGRIGSPWGIKGEVKIALHTDFPERFLDIQVVYLGADARPVRILSSRFHKNQALCQIEGYSDRSAVEPLRGLWVQVPVDEIMPLAEDEHYIFDLIGLRIRTSDGRDLGEIKEVLFTGANEVFVVRGEQGEVLIPYIDDVIAQENLAAGEIIINPVPGLLS